MSYSKTFLFLLFIGLLSSCASSYKPIDPSSFNYLSNDINNGVTVSYRYDLLDKKYAKKESKNNTKLIAVKITNTSEKDWTVGKDLQFVYDNGQDVFLLETQAIFKTLKQSPASYLWYLLLTPTQFNTTKTNSYGVTEQTSSFPIGVIIGPGIAGGNIIAASTANKKFKNDLNEYNLLGKTIKKGTTVYGLLGLQSSGYHSIRILLKNNE